MLSRTADHLFWMARYIERAENTARMLDVLYRTSLLPLSNNVNHSGWQGILSITNLQTDYAAYYPEVTSQGVLDFMIRDERNPSSIISCLRASRENARAVRGMLTTEVWETQNQTWLEAQKIVNSNSVIGGMANFFEWVKLRSHLSRGDALATMLHDDAFQFLRLGTFLERADNTARLLDVRFHAPQSDFFGSIKSNSTESEPDFYHWSILLRSVSAFEIYRRVYKDAITPEHIADLLILRADMPRSLHHCLEQVVYGLSLLVDQPSEAQRCAGRLYAELKHGSLPEILSDGLHHFLHQFLTRINEVGTHISNEFLVSFEV